MHCTNSDERAAAVAQRYLHELPADSAPSGRSGAADRGGGRLCPLCAVATAHWVT
jgi:hypothetical protein